MQRLLLVLFVLVMGLAIGFAAGRYQRIRENPMAAVEIPAEPPPSRVAGQSRILDALLIQDPFERVRALAALTDLSAEEVAQIPDALKTTAVDRDLPEAALLLRLWARRDPEAATHWVLTETQQEIRPPLLKPAVEEWAARDPEAAAQGLQEVILRSPGPTVQAAEVALMRGWFDSGHYEGLQDYLLGQGVTFDQQRAIKAFVRRMIQRAGPQAAIDWAEALPDEPSRFKLAAFRQVSAELGKTDAQVALRWCEKHCQGPYGEGLEQQIAVGWATYEPEQAIRWLAKMPEGQERDLAVLSAYRFWWQQERGGAARRWLEQIGRDGFEPWMAPMAIIYAPMLALEDPVEATKWAMLTPADRREQVLVAVGRRWSGQDPEAAEAWIEQAPLSPESKEKARKGLQKGRPRG